MKQLKIDDVKVGANFWGSANNVKLFCIFFFSEEVEGEPTAETGKKVVKSMLDTLAEITETKGLQKEFQEALIPDDPYVKSRFVFVGTCLAENRFTQATTLQFLDSLSTDSAKIQTDQLYKKQRTGRNAPRFDWVGTFKYRGENFRNKFNEVVGWYEHFNILLPLVDLSKIQKAEDVRELTCLQLIQHLFCCPGFILHSEKDLETFEKFYQPIVGNNHIDYTRVHLLPSKDYPKEKAEELIQYCLKNRFKLQPLKVDSRFKNFYIEELWDIKKSWFQ